MPPNRQNCLPPKGKSAYRTRGKSAYHIQGKSAYRDKGKSAYHTKEKLLDFCILDEAEGYFVGASLKDAGKKSFAITAIEDSDTIASILKRLEG